MLSHKYEVGLNRSPDFLLWGPLVGLCDLHSPAISHPPLASLRSMCCLNTYSTVDGGYWAFHEWPCGPCGIFNCELVQSKQGVIIWFFPQTFYICEYNYFLFLFMILVEVKTVPITKLLLFTPPNSEIKALCLYRNTTSNTSSITQIHNIQSICLLINLHFVWHLTNLFLVRGKNLVLQLLKFLAMGEIMVEIHLQPHRA